MYLVTVYVPVSLTCYVYSRINLILARSFHVAAPTVWNSLPADIRACTFYCQLKTYFNNAFSMLLGP